MAADGAPSGRPTLVKAEGRTPPHDLEAEAAVLSAVVLDETALDKVEDILRPEHFYSEAHRRIYEAAQALRAAGSPVDMVQAMTWLRDRDRLAQVGGAAYLTEVVNAAPAVANVRAYAETVVDKAMARRVISVCQTFTAVGYSDYGSAMEYVGNLARDVNEIAMAGDTAATSSTIGVIIADNVRAAAAAADKGTGVLGLPTGFDRYDRLTSGLHDGELTVVAARPGMGKTSLVLQMAITVAGGEDADGHPNAVGFFSLEMPRAQIGMRSLCCQGKVDVARFRAGMLNDTDWSRLQNAASALNGRALTVDDQGGISLVQLRAKARRMMSEAILAGQRLRLLVIDYLQLMGGSGKEQNREQEISEISRGLKALAKELGLPIIALSQLNRAVETRGEKNKRPILSDLRESGAIEQDADNVCFIYRDDYYNKDSPDRNLAELILAKQRNGPNDTVKVRFDGQYTRFDNLPEGEWNER